MPQHVIVVGAGYVGLPTAAVLSSGSIDGRPVEVLLVDRSHDRLTTVIAGEDPIGEPMLGDLLLATEREWLGGVYPDAPPRAGVRLRCAGRDAIEVGSLPAALGAVRVVWVLCLGTPATQDGLDGRALLDACESIAGSERRAPGRTRCVVIRSTVTPDLVAEARRALNGIPLVVAPEFLREGHAVADVSSPTRVVVGADDPELARWVARLLAPDCGAVVADLTPEEACIVKLGSNALLAARAAWATRLGHAVRRHCPGGDLRRVLHGVGLDPRLAGAVTAGPGLGVGGPCLPKDAAAFDRVVGDGAPAGRAIEVAGEHVRSEIRVWLARHGVRSVVMLGLGFKPDSTDTRDSPAAELADLLERDGIRVVVLPGTCTTVADAIVLCRRPTDAELPMIAATALVVDPYAILTAAQVAARGAGSYWGAGRGAGWPGRSG